MSFLLIVNVGRYVLPKYVKQEAYAIALGLMWPKHSIVGNLQAHRRELRRHRQIRSEAIKALKVNVKKKEHYEYFQEKVEHASSDGDTNDSASVSTELICIVSNSFRFSKMHDQPITYLLRRHLRD